MSELKAYVKPLKTNMFGKTIVGQSYYLKSEADEVIAELKDKALQYKVLNEEHCRDLNTQERFFAEQIAHHKYKRCLAMAYVEWLKQLIIGYHPESILFRRAFRRERKWKELAEKFKEAK